MKIKIVAEPEYDLVTKVGSINFEYGVRGRELELELRKAQGMFVRAMELQGLGLVRNIPQNPRWVTGADGELSAFYALDWEGKRKRTEIRSGGLISDLPTPRERSLEDSRGEVEYRIVGVFWGAGTTMEVLRDKARIKSEERYAKRPVTYGHGGRSEMEPPKVGRDYRPDL